MKYAVKCIWRVVIIVPTVGSIVTHTKKINHNGTILQIQHIFKKDSQRINRLSNILV